MIGHTESFRLEDADEPERVIRGVVTRPPAPASPAIGDGLEGAGVLILHGFKGFFRWGFFPELQRRLATAGLTTVAFNLSGSGVGDDLESFTEGAAFEHASPSRDLEDIERVRTWIEKAGVPGLDPSRLALFGHSRGGASMLLHAERRGDYRAVATWAATAHSIRFSPEVMARWREDGFLDIPNLRTQQVHRMGLGWLEDVERNRAALDAPSACARLETPTLLVHGTADEAVPHGEGEVLRDAFRPGVARLLSIPGAGHTFGAVHPFQGTTPELERCLEATQAFLVAKLG